PLVRGRLHRPQSREPAGRVPERPAARPLRLHAAGVAGLPRLLRPSRRHALHGSLRLPAPRVRPPMSRPSCLLVALLFGALFALYFVVFTRYFEWPGNLIAAGFGSVFGAMGLAAVFDTIWA